MRTLCAQCRRIVRDDGGGAGSKGELCRECAEYAAWLRARIPGREGLDGFSRPVLVTTVDGRVVAANAAFADLTGSAPRDLEGWLTGDALACERARQPGGCGRTVHCRDCVLRRMVLEVARTRIARWRVPAYIPTPRGRVELCVTIRPEGDNLVVIVLEDLPAQAAESA